MQMKRLRDIPHLLSRKAFAAGLALTLLISAPVLAFNLLPAQAQAVDPPAAPTGLSASGVSSDSVTLTWDDPGDSSITGHQVLRRSRDGGEYGDGEGAAEFAVIADDTGSAAATYTDASVTPRTRYVYRVKAINPAGTSGQSSYLNVETLAVAEVPEAPTALSAPSATHESVTLTWDDPGDSSITGHQVLRRFRDGDEYGDGEGAAEFAVIADDTGSAAATYTDASVTPRTRYVYRVKAINPAGTSGQSSYLNVETLAVAEVPEAPTALSAPSATHESVTLTWDDPGDSSITGHQVLRRFRDGDEYGDGEGAAEFAVIEENTGSAAATHTDSSVTARTRYAYSVKAISAAGTSGQSGHLDVETPEAPAERPLSPARGSRPNVVIILADDLGWGDIKTNNPDSAMKTPRIDGIATAGVNFTDAHSPSAACTGTRYGLLTGRYSWRSWMKLGVLNGYDRPLIGPDRPTLGTLLQGHGYRTAAVGKWHLGMDFVRLSDIDEVTEVNRGIDFSADILDSPMDHGFDEFFGTSANLTWRVPVYIRDNRFTAIPLGTQLPALGNIKNDQVLDRLTREATEFIEEAAEDDAPFFIYLPLNAPHEPLAPNARFRDSTGLGHYGDFVAQIDWAVGQVLDTLEGAGELDNTIVIVTSDNGSFMQRQPNHFSNDHVRYPGRYSYRTGIHQSNADWRYGKGSIYEGGHRIPFLLQWPDAIGADSTVDATVSLTDLYATLAEILGVEPELGAATDSVSILRLMLREPGTRGVPVVHHSNEGEFAIRDGRWKLVFHDPRELYDLEENPRERNNLAAARPGVVAQLEATLDDIRAAEDGTLSGDATLSKLSLAGIGPGAFDPDELSYSATVDRGIETVEVTVLPTETDARVSISTPEGRLLYGKPPRGRVEVGLAGTATTTIAVRVTAPDRSATTTYTVTVTRAGEAVIAGIPMIGETLTADTSGISDEDGLDNAAFSHQWVSNDGSGDADISGAVSATHVLTAGDLGKTIRVRVSFTDDAGNAEIRTSEATDEVKNALTVETQNVPDSHDGAGTFDVRILFSEAVTVSYQTLRSHSFEVSGGTITGARRVDGRNDLWEITVQPEGDSDVLLALPPSGDCQAQGAVCTRDRRPLSSRLEITVPGPDTAPVNSPAQGAPTISGTPEVGQTFSADTGGITDADGLQDATFTYQWVSSDGATDSDIPGETGATYVVLSGDVGKTLKVQVSFTDDEGYDETLASAATAAVSATVPGTPRSLDVQTGGTGELAATWQPPESNGGTDVTEYQVQWKLATGSWNTEADVSSATATGTSHTITSLSLNTEYAVRVIAANEVGDGPPSAEETEIARAKTSSQQDSASNTPATGGPTITGTAEVGETLSADTSGIADENGLDNASFSYQWVRSDASIVGATGATYTVHNDDAEQSLRVQVSFTDDDGFEESLNSDAAPIPVPTPLTASFDASTVPESHDGSNTFTLEFFFNKEPSLEQAAVRDHVVTITGGEITGARQTTQDSSLRWMVTVQPEGQDDVTVTLPRTTDCDDQGAVCTAHGQMLAQDVSTTVNGPEPEQQDGQQEEEETREEGPTEPPPAPTNLTGVINGDGTITITWTGPEDDSVTGYQILRRRPEWQETELKVYVDDTSNTQTSYTDTNTVEYTRYIYRVKARNAAGLSEGSNFVRLDKTRED